MKAETFISLLTIYNKRRSRLDYFTMNPPQEELLEVLHNHDRVIILKARQLGISTLARAWMFYQAYFAEEPMTYACIAHNHQAAMNLHKMDKTFYGNLPKTLRKKVSKENTQELEFADSGASIKTFTAGAKTGTRSFQLDAVHLSEFAFYEDQEEILATILASVGGGQVIIESTPNEMGDKFHELVMETIETNGENGWHLCFFPWDVHEDYYIEPQPTFRIRDTENILLEENGWSVGQIAWRRKQIATLGKEKFYREYPASVAEAFRFTGKNYFSGVALDRIKPIKDTTNKYSAVGEPVSGLDYVISADVGGGLGQDYSVACVLSAATRQPVAWWWCNQTSPAKFAEKLFDLGCHWNMAELIVESNNTGQVVLYKLNEMGYTRWLWKSEKGKPFLTTKRTRPLLFEGLRETLDDGLLLSLPMSVLEELRSIIYVNKKPQHPRSGHDDKVMALALACYAVREYPIKVVHNHKEHFFNQLKRKRRAREASRKLPWDIRSGDKKGSY